MHCWDQAAEVVHAPSSVLTYEPQWSSDVNSVYENVTSGEVYPYEFLVENVPEQHKRNVDYVLSLMDWEKNVDPHYKRHYYRPPIVCSHSDEQYKELTVMPRQMVTVKDEAAYGCILVQGHGTFGLFDCEGAIMLRFGQRSADEYFVSKPAARKGVTITNHSRWEPLVILKHFGPNHPDMPADVPA